MTDLSKTTLPNDTIHAPTAGNEVFILGAGFSKAIADHMPTMNELSVNVIEKLFNDRDLTSTVPDLLRHNIELLMTYLSQPQPWLKETDIDFHRSLGGQIRTYIADIIEERITLASETKAPQWLRDLILAWHAQQSVIITLNYDTLIERAARDLKVINNKVLLPACIYPPYFANIASRSGQALWGYEVPLTFRLLKLHGSVNWHYSGRKNFYGETIFFSDVPEFGSSTDQNSHKTTELRQMAADKETLLIPPESEKTTYFENETIRTLWNDAATAIQNASALYIIGYSLPPSDLGMFLFLVTNCPKNVPIYLVDIEPKLIGHYQKILPNFDIREKYLRRDDPVINFACNYTQYLITTEPLAELCG